MSLFRSLFQFGYTTVFGWYAAFIFLRTGSLPAVIFAHSFCNWCGLPRLSGRVEAAEPIGPPVVGERGKEDGDSGNALRVGGEGRLGVKWTVAYYLVLVGGVVAFYQGLWRLTESDRALASFGPATVK